MATFNQRAVAIADAVVNGTSTAGQRQRVLSAFGSAEEFVKQIRHFTLTRISNYEADGPVSAARQAAEGAVTADFSEAP